MISPLSQARPVYQSDLADPDATPHHDILETETSLFCTKLKSGSGRNCDSFWENGPGREWSTHTVWRSFGMGSPAQDFVLIHLDRESAFAACGDQRQ